MTNEDISVTEYNAEEATSRLEELWICLHIPDMPREGTGPSSELLDFFRGHAVTARQSGCCLAK